MVIGATDHVAIEETVVIGERIEDIEGIVAAAAYTSAASIMLKAMAPEIVAGCTVERCARAAHIGGTGLNAASTKQGSEN